MGLQPLRNGNLNRENMEIFKKKLLLRYIKKRTRNADTIIIIAKHGVLENKS